MLDYKTVYNETDLFDLSFQPFDKDFKPFNDEDETFKKFSSAGFTLSLSRVPTPFVINTFLPTGLLTLISFIGFVIPVDMVPGRMALLVTIFLMLVNISAMENYRGPVVRTPNFLLLCLQVIVVLSDHFRLEK